MVVPLAVVAPVETGTRKGSANTASGATSHRRRDDERRGGDERRDHHRGPDDGLQRMAMDDVELRRAPDVA